MGSLEFMKKKLEPLGIYSLDDDSIVMVELTTYANELDRVYEALSELERECFVETATDYGLSIRERAYTSPRVDLSYDDRRKMLLYRMAITSNDFDKASIEKALLAAGIDGYIIESPGAMKIEINVQNLFDTMATKVEAKQAAEKFLPAHLAYAFDFIPRTWAQLDAEDLDFAEFDARDLTWEEMDGYYT